MKIRIKNLSVLTATLLLAATAASAATSYEDAYIEKYKGRTDIPAPVEVVTPTFSSRPELDRVIVKFTVDAAGKPTDIIVADDADMDLKRSLSTAIAAWKFTPAMANGTPVAKTVVLPVLLN